jgi:uncharacterized membrane protein (DUF485 family)
VALRTFAGKISVSLAPLSAENSMQRNTRQGLVLFFVYLVLYGGFVLINAFAPETMEKTPLAGVNLAILSGFGLILAAFLLAVIYGLLCRGRSDEEGEQ